jgi:hypothetical protein
MGCQGETDVPAPEPSLDKPPAAAPAPRAGDSPLRYEGGLVWVEMQAVDPRRLLWELSEQAGFLLDVTDLDATPVSLHLEAAQIQEVVAVIARRAPFALEFEHDPLTGRHHVVSVRVGRAPELVVSAPRPPPLPRSPSLPQPPEESLRERRSPDHERLIRALNIANVDARRELVEDLDPVGVELDVLSYVMENDPEPEIRAVAADALVSSGSYGAVRSLIAALDSKDPAVLLLAVEALEFAGDDSVVPDLERLFDHPDSAVSTAAREAADFLR